MPPMTTMKAEATDNQAPFSEHGPAASMLSSPQSSAKLEESAPLPYPETNPTTTIEEVTNSQALEDSENVEQEATFPQQLMDAIEQETKDGGATINGLKVVEWLPSGDAFVIRDKKSFERVVLPRYFSAKCKFMSFVRKLYRWGFRQVEKDRQGIMVFMHINFIRGDKQRCLKMRSIVKKQHAQPQPFAAYGRLQPFGLNQFGMMGSNLLGNAMSMSQFQPSNQMYPSFNQGGDNMMNAKNARGVGLGGSSSLFAPNQFRGNMGMPSMNIPNQFSRNTMGMEMPNQFPGNAMGVASQDKFNAGLQLESMLNNNTGPTLSPLNQGFAATTQNDNFGNCFNGGNKSENEMASEMIRGDQGMEPWRALGIANHLSYKQ
mmetsp:Transcript_18495/g.38882  ORF Transcript_18495/g.38882 Transcript_18495/m.38882 type:complete len:375 (-) Transcript_18495:124-1248(-)